MSMFLSTLPGNRIRPCGLIPLSVAGKSRAGSGAFMKGRRKVKTLKWQMRAQFEAEAFALAGIKSPNQELFMRVATQAGRNAEPVGVMAGTYNTDSSAS